MTTQSVIPLSNVPQTFEITLAGVDYIFTCKWNDVAQCWILDIDDADSQTNLVAGLPLVTGVDLLDGLDYIGINGQLVVYTDGNQDAIPDLNTLGDSSNLYFVTTAAS